ncbi:MAG: hypothetical protein RL108_1826 [Bacteroidota bacterium]|jgi:hypothetical protein
MNEHRGLKKLIRNNYYANNLTYTVSPEFTNYIFYRHFSENLFSNI